MKKLSVIAVVALLASALNAAVIVDFVNKRDRVFKPEEIAKTEEIAPKKLLRKPAKTRNILVFTRTAGYRHCDGIPAFNELLKAMDKNFKGSWNLTFTEDIEMFKPEVLKKFDCIILNNPTGPFFGADEKARKEMTKEERDENNRFNNSYLQHLLDYVENGGGVMGLHAACDANGGTRYVEMMGGLFAGHPWNADNPDVTVIIEEPNSALLRNVWKGKEFKIQDEIYTFRDESFDRGLQRVLMSLDYDRSPLKDPSVDAMTKTSRKSKDFGLAWVKTFGKGRIFYGAFGHRHDVYMRNPELAEFYCRGIQFACGDLKVETAPRGELKPSKK